MADSKLIIWISDNVSLTGLNKLTTTLGTVKTKIADAFKTASVKAFKASVVAVTSALVGAVVEAARFNVQMAKVWTMAGGGIDNFKELREQARGLASDFGIARSEIATGMYNALSAGVDQSSLEGFMTQAAKVAVADGSDISTAVDGITTVLNAFKIEASKTEEVADDLFQTVRQGKTTFGELAANLATVAPVAAASNIPLKEILAHVAALTAQGTPTAQAMTQIRASIQGLNKALGDGWSDNLTYQDALKKVWSLAGESQTELLKMVGSTEAVQAVLGGVGINADMAAEKLRGMADTAGAAQEAFEKVDQFRHWPTLLETVRGTLSKLGEEIDSRLHPFVVKVTEQIRDWRDDGGLWDKIGGFLDTAESKLQSIADIVQQIKSLEDVTTVLGVVGDWLKDKLIEGLTEGAQFLLEKAPLIGDAIGEAAKNAMKGPLEDRAEALQQTREQFGIDAGGEFSFSALKTEMSSAFKEALDQNRAAIKSERLAAEGQELSGRIAGEAGSGASLSELLIAALAANHANDPVPPAAEAVETTTEAAEATKTAGEASGEAAEATKTASEASTKAAESATKAAEATKTAAEAVAASQQVEAYVDEDGYYLDENGRTSRMKKNRASLNSGDADWGPDQAFGVGEEADIEASSQGSYSAVEDTAEAVAEAAKSAETAALRSLDSADKVSTAMSTCSTAMSMVGDLAGPLAESAAGAVEKAGVALVAAQVAVASLVELDMRVEELEYQIENMRS